MRALSLLVATLLCVACNPPEFRSSQGPYTLIAPVSVAPLEREEYSIVNKIKGQATIDSRVFDLQVGFEEAKQAATFNALQNVREADVIIAPRFEISYEPSREAGVFWTIRAKVVGLAIKIKSDEELNSAGAKGRHGSESR